MTDRWQVLSDNKCDKCENNGVVGACQGRYDTGMNWVCNFYPKNGSATITIHNTFVEASTEGEVTR